MLADGTGIALQVMGALPARDPGHITSQGRLAGAGVGRQKRVGFKGVLPYEDNPRVVSPASGLHGQHQQQDGGPAVPDACLASTGATPQRIQRWLTLMKAREVHTRESFIEAQLGYGLEPDGAGAMSCR